MNERFTGSKKNDTSKSAKTARYASMLMELEQRIAFDGAAVETIEHANDGDAGDAPDAQGGGAAHAADTGQHDALVKALDLSVPAAHNAEAPLEAPKQVVFVDARVEEPELLLSQIEGEYEIVMLKAGKDGMAQISAALSGMRNVDAIHILSHGSAGSLTLGSGELNFTTMTGEYADELDGLRASLADDADILIYGCDFGNGALGARATQALAALTGADIAASTDDTGAARFGGDWQLETATGTIEARALAADQWDHLLAPPQLLGGPNLVGNGSFTTNTGGWSTNVGGVERATPGTFGVAASPDGGNVVEVEGTVVANPTTTPIYIETTVTTVVGQTYEFSLYATTRQAGGGGGNVGDRGMLSVDGVSLLNFTTGNTWQLYTAQFTATSTSSFIRITSDGSTGGGNPLPGDGSGLIIDGVAVHQANANLTASYTEGGPGVAVVNPGLTIRDNDGPNMSSAKVAIANPQTGDQLFVNGTLPAGIIVTYDVATGTLTLTGSATKANYEAALDLVQYRSTSPDPSETPRTINVTVNDGATDSAAAVTTLSVAAVARPPVVDLNSGVAPTNIIPARAAFTGSEPGNLTWTGISGWDRGQAPSGAAKLTFDLGWDNNSSRTGRFEITIGGVVYAVFTTQDLAPTTAPAPDPALGTWTFMNGASGTPASIQSSTSGAWTMYAVNIDLPADVAAIGDLVIAYTEPNGATTDSYNVVNVSALTTHPAIAPDVTAGVNFTTSYTENGAPVSIADTDSSVRDSDSATMQSATIVLTNAQAGDLLSVLGTLPGGISSSIDTSVPGRITVTLSGRASAGDYNLAIRQIGYSSASDAPSAVNRAIDVTVNDGEVNSAVATTTITVAAVNDAPVGSDDAIAVLEDTLFNGTLPAATDADGDTLTYTAGDQPAHGIVAVNVNGSYSYTPTAGYYGPDSFTYSVSDGTVPRTYTVSVAVNDRPVVDLNSGTVPSELVPNGNFGAGLTGWTQTGSTLNNSLGGGVFNFFGDNATSQLTSSVTSGWNVGNAPSGSAQLMFDVGWGNGGSVAATARLDIFVGGVLYARITTGAGASTTGTVAYFDGASGNLTTLGPGSVSSKMAIDLPADVAATGSVAFSFNSTGGSLDDFSIDNITALTTDPARGTDVTPGVNFTTSYAENGAPVSIADIDSSVRDGDDTTMQSATIVLTNAQAGDLLSVLGTLPGGISSSIDTSVPGRIKVSLSGSASTGDYNLAIRQIGFSSASETPSAVNRTIDVTVNDGEVDSAVATTTVTVTPVNDAPVGSDDAITTAEDTVFNGTLPPATDLDGDPVAYGPGATGPSNGTVTINANGTYTYTPSPDFNGADSFSYTVSDGQGGINEYVVSVTVTPVNDAPVGSDDAITTAEDTVFNGTLPVATDVDGDTLEYFAGSQPAHGTVTVNADGTYSYTPDADYNGPDSFTYTVSDGTVAVPYVVSVTVTPVNDAPVGSDDAITTAEDTVFNSTLPPATDLDGDPVAYGPGATGPSNGTVTINANGTYTYTPSPDFNGADSFSYTVSDGQGGINEYVVSVTVTPVNDAPVGSDDAITTAEDTVFNGTLPVATDVDGDTLEYFAGSQPAHGTVTVNADGTYSYTPDADYNGPDSFTYTVSDGTVAVPYVVSITVTPVNDAPDAIDDSFATSEDTPVTFDPRTNDTDVEANPLTIVAINGTAITVGVPVTATGGAITLNGDGTLTFTPAANFNGNTSFTYTISDGNGGTDTATVNGSVAAVNDAPTASDTTVTTQEDTAIVNGTLPPATDLDGDPVAYGPGATGPSNGTVTINANGTYTYTPSPDFNGADSFSYTVSDGQGGINEYVVSVTVTPVNDAPVGSDDAITTAEDTVFNGTLPVATDVDGDTLEYFAGSQPAHGTVTVNADGTYSYTPDADYNGPDSFTYTVSDGTVAVPYVVSITVTPVNDAPDAIDDSFATSEDTPVTFDPRTNDTDVEANPLTIVAINGTAITVGVPVTATGGAITLNGDGTLTFTPAANFNGNTSFTYTISDGNGGTDTATVNGSVAAVNDAPTASDTTVTTQEDTAIVNGTLPPATDLDGDPVAYGPGATGPSNGTVTINANGTYTYTPSPDFNGADSFSYTVSDGQGGINEYVVSVTVTPVNDAPVGSDDAITTAEDTVFNGTLPVATDVDGDTLEYFAGSQPAHGTVTVNADGTYSYTPDADYNGPDSFTYTVSDGTVAVPYVVSITVTPVNDAPDAIDDSFATSEDTPVTFDPRTNDTDVEANPLTIVAINGTAITVGVPVTATGGAITLNGDGTLTFTPAANFNGNTSFTYTISDGNGGTDTATVNGSVAAVNDAPTASDTTVTTQEDTAIVNGTLPPATDLDGDPVAYGPGATGPSNGTVTINANGTYTYTPSPDFNGADSFSYTVSDGQGGINEYVVSVTVTPVNDAPVGSDDAITTAEDTVFNGTLPVATDVDGDTLEYFAGSQPAHGTVTVNADGTYSYTPDADYNGPDSFTYTVSDGTVAVPYVVSITVTPVNDAPDAIDDSFATSEDTPVTFDPRTNDTDVEANPLTIVAINGTAITVGVPVTATGGAITLNGDGTLTFTPAANFNGNTSFTYTISDGNGGTDTATVNGSVAAVNDAPTASDTTVTTQEDTAIVNGTLPPATDLDGDPVAYGPGATGPSNGTVTINANGTYTYTPSPDFNGADSFSYTVSDGQGGINEYVVSVTVTPVNDAPVGSDDAITTAEDTVFNGTLPVATDVDGDTLEYFAGSQPAHGTVTVNADGTYSYTPDADYNGPDSFTYTVSDGTVAVPYVVSVTVTPDTGSPPLLERDPPSPALPDGTPIGVPEWIALDGEVRNAIHGDAGATMVGGIIERAVNEAQRLNGVAGVSTNGMITNIVRQTGAWESYGELDDVDRIQLERGGSSVTAGAGGNGDAWFSVEAFLRAGQLYVLVSDNGGAAADIRVTLADGRALPGWLALTRQGAVIGKPPAGMPFVDLRVQSTIDGTVLSDTMRIDLSTGWVIDHVAEKRADLGGNLFSTALETEANRSYALASALGAALGLPPKN